MRPKRRGERGRGEADRQHLHGVGRPDQAEDGEQPILERAGADGLERLVDGHRAHRQGLRGGVDDGGAAQPKLGLAAPTVAIKPRAGSGRRGGGAGGGSGDGRRARRRWTRKGGTGCLGSFVPGAKSFVRFGGVGSFVPFSNSFVSFAMPGWRVPACAGSFVPGSGSGGTGCLGSFVLRVVTTSDARHGSAAARRWPRRGRGGRRASGAGPARPPAPRASQHGILQHP